MDRTQWRQERRLWNEVQMDTIYARQYDEHWGASINPSHRSMLERLLDLCPPRGYLLDAACGTGKYWPLLLERGFSVMGTDQSQQMLQRAHEKFPDVAIQHVGLQVLRNFTTALHENGHLYFTVEVESAEALHIAYEAGKRLALPLVYGEYAHHGGYHYYPTDEQVRTWLAETQFTLLDVTEGDGYRHYLTRK